MEDTANIEAELFHYSQIGKSEDIVIAMNSYILMSK
ncbi:hypothetical protein SAMN05443529_11687 [Desulfosporosinus hippei DSM 8344]|uniref:Uncharacterized protein n=1 Tax=Desulfosporosinus hippei DSM 8344 TaxID=1121419 RepID=A0A1G8E8T1_9FIRM|nr:hypothetical protein SAMN05443529_11687 [Desulfosporosinus hippei DSM 8344]